MKLASHNSFSSYQPKRWWMKLINPFAKCQDKSISQQYDDGVRMFDIRVRPHTCEAAHGLVVYEYVNIAHALEWLDTVDEKVYVRLCCEGKLEDTEWFKDYFSRCVEDFPNITFFGGYIKQGWTKVIDCEDPICLELYRTFNHYKSEKGWNNKLKSIFDYILHPFPRYWAKKDNAKYIAENKDSDLFIMLDFYDTEN